MFFSVDARSQPKTYWDRLQHSGMTHYFFLSVFCTQGCKILLFQQVYFHKHTCANSFCTSVKPPLRLSPFQGERDYFLGATISLPLLKGEGWGGVGFGCGSAALCSVANFFLGRFGEFTLSAVEVLSDREQASSSSNNILDLSHISL